MSNIHHLLTVGGEAATTELDHYMRHCGDSTIHYTRRERSTTATLSALITRRSGRAWTRGQRIFIRAQAETLCGGDPWRHQVTPWPAMDAFQVEAAHLSSSLLKGCGKGTNTAV